MGKFTKRELEVIDFLLDSINSDMAYIGINVESKTKLEYSLCSTDEERNQLTKKKLAFYKSNIDNCDPVVADFVLPFVNPTPEQIDNYDEFTDTNNKNFIIYLYDELIQSLLDDDLNELDKYNFEYVVKSKGFRYKLIKNYITAVGDVFYYNLYKSMVEEQNISDVKDDNKNKTLNNTNPYPRLFTSDIAYNKFINLFNEFGNTKENLANYSFVFHRMKKDNFIYKELKQLEFIDFLSSFEIHLDRLKPISQLGNNDLREGIYNRI